MLKTKSSSYKEQNLFALLNVKEERRKEFEILSKVLQQWKNQELHYSKRVQEISEILYSVIKEKSYGVYTLYEQLRQALTTIATQAKNLALKISDDILIQIREISKKLIPDIKTGNDIQKNGKNNIISKRKNIEKIRAQYLKINKEMEESQILNLITMNSVESTPEAKIKQSNKTLEIEKDTKVLEFKCKEVIEEYNKSVILYNRELKSLLTRFEEQEKYIIKILYESVLKMELHLETQQKTVQHEINRLSQMTTKFSKEQCYDEFYKMYKTNPQNIFFEGVEYIPIVTFITNTIKNVNQKKFEQIIEYSKNKQAKFSIEKVFKTESEIDQIQNEELKKIIQFFLLTVSGEPNHQYIDQFSKLLNKDFQNRINFVSCLQQYRILGKFEIKSSIIFNVYNMLVVFLNACVQNLDSYIAKQLMILLFTYFVSFEDINLNQLKSSREKIYLQQFLKNHAIWKRTDYWESILFECIYEQKKSLKNNNFDRQHEIESEKNAVFNQLACLTHNMILFGLSQKEVKQFGSKYSKLFNLGTLKWNDVQKNISAAIIQFNHMESNQLVKAIVQQIR